MNLIETLRGQIVRNSVARLGATWPERRDALLAPLAGKMPTSARHIVGLGDALSDAFQIPSLRNSRNQSSLSQAGDAWTRLVAYYLNLALAGTDAIALTETAAPQCLKKALKVTYHTNSATALESDLDLVVVHAPGASNIAPVKSFKNSAQKEFSAYAEAHFAELSAVLFQLKTNWNDSAQPAMLWNMVYNLAAKGMPDNGFSVGSGGFHLKALKSFLYAFATVPTQKDLSKFKSTHVPVLRVLGCSGGAYWGRPSVPGVMNSVTAFFDLVYNRTKFNFPAPAQIGAGYFAELTSSPAPALIDLDAFALF
jgi:hypothetical protein